MKRVLLSLAIVALAVGSLFGAETVQHRGIWMHPEQFKTPQLADAWIEKIAAAHLNAIYPLVWYHGGIAWFKTELSPMGKDAPEGFDPLGHLVKIAHARGIAVHAWFVNGAYGAPTTRGLFVEHPDWQLQSRGGDAWYDLGKPVVRDFQRKLMLDCLRKYDLDGLHFDYIRYDSQAICYCEHCQNEFAAKYGFRPLRAGEERLPALLDLSANPLDKPPTAQVLATFENGKPAIALNRLGEGEALLLNWRAARGANPAVDEFVKQTRTRFAAGPKNTFQLHTTATAAKYARQTQTQAGAWLRGLGFPTKLIDETALAKVPRGATLLLYGQYYVPAETAKWLEDFVQAGGHCLVVDGPVFAMKSESLQRVLGLKSVGKFFPGATLVAPAPGQDQLKSGPAIDVAKERERQAKWVEYRTWTGTELVRSVYRDAKALKPKAWVSAAVFFKKDSADLVCQDWYGWLREGTIDYVLPMAYTEDPATLTNAFAEWKAADPNMERIIPGLSIYSKKDGKAGPRDLALVQSQLDLCHTNATHGNLFFSLQFLNEPLIKLLADGPFAEPARPWYPPRR